jgi:hypothetical protein
VVGKIGDDLRMDYTAQGHTVGLAARMEQIVAADSIYISEHTAKLVSGYFALRDLGETRIKGLSDLLHVFELEGVGRMRTRLALEAALEQAIAGNAQVVGVVAEPGTGKSRLCYEFAERCRVRGIVVYEAHGLSHTKLVPFYPILELLRAVFRIAEQDGNEAAREKIAGRMLLLDETLAEGLPLMFDFLGVPDPERPAPPLDPEARQGAASQPDPAALARAKRPGAGRHSLRGPPLARSAKRRIRREPRHRDRSRQPDAHTLELSSRVPRFVDA